MKIKELLGMLVLDANANEIGKIVDAEFDPAEGKLANITVDLKKNFISSNKIDVDYADIKSIGDYVLLTIEINKEEVIEEAEKAAREAKEAERAAREAEREAKKAEREAKKAEREAEREAKKAEKEELLKKQVEEQKEVVEAEIVDDEAEAEEETTDVEIE